MDAFTLVMGGLGAGGITAAVITWVRFRKKDKVDIHKTVAETVKTDAETRKLEAEATEVMIRNLQTVIVRCENEIKRMEVTIAELRTDLYKAQKIIRNYAGQNVDDKQD